MHRFCNQHIGATHGVENFIDRPARIDESDVLPLADVSPLIRLALPVGHERPSSSFTPDKVGKPDPRNERCRIRNRHRGRQSQRRGRKVPSYAVNDPAVIECGRSVITHSRSEDDGASRLRQPIVEQRADADEVDSLVPGEYVRDQTRPEIPIELVAEIDDAVLAFEVDELQPLHLGQRAGG